VDCVSVGDCSAGQVCAANVCRDTCTSDKACTPQGLLCDKVGGHCVECLASTDCSANRICVAGACTAANAGNGGGTGAGGALNGGGGFIGAGGSLFGGGGTGAGGGNTCQGTVFPASGPTDLAILLDESGSMSQSVSGGTKWTVVTGALGAFLQDPKNADLGVALNYFPVGGTGTAPSSCTTNADCVINGTDYGPCLSTIGFGICTNTSAGCNVADYATPVIPFALPPDHAGAVASLSAHGPAGGTPTRPALEATSNYAKSWATQHPERKVSILLITDGDPTGCTTNAVTDVANLASTTFTTSHIPTFVIGIGSSLTSLNQIAAAGGTGQAYVLDTATDLTKPFNDALTAIRGRVSSCSFPVPVGANPNLVNVAYDTAAGSQTLPISSTCAAGGWHYDNPSNPTTIVVCPSSCTTVTAATNVRVVVGCPANVAP
jgi:hypothetical protein